MEAKIIIPPLVQIPVYKDRPKGCGVAAAEHDPRSHCQKLKGLQAAFDDFIPTLPRPASRMTYQYCKDWRNSTIFEEPIEKPIVIPLSARIEFPERCRRHWAMQSFPLQSARSKTVSYL